LAHPPQTHIRKKLEPHDPRGNQSGSRHRIEWTACGWTAGEFLDRRVALDHAAGKRAEVPGARAQGSGPLDWVRI